MSINVNSEAELEETVYALGYELIEKQLNGSSLTETELSFIDYIHQKIDEQIQRLLQQIVI